MDVFRILKFKFIFDFKVLDVLKDMGLICLFKFIGGGLIEMVDLFIVGVKLYVLNIFYKVCIEVDEEGN